MSLVAREIDYTAPRECYQEGAGPVFEFPFEDNGDFSTFTVARSYKQTPAGFVADKLAGRFRPGEVRDHEYGNTFLLATSVPQPTPTGLYAFTRTFATIPGVHVDYSTINITKPDPGALGSLLATSTYDGIPLVTNLGRAYSYLGYVWAANQIWGPTKSTSGSTTSGSDRRLTFASPHGVTTQDILVSDGTPVAIRLAAAGYSVVDPTTIDILGAGSIGINRLSIYYRDYTPGLDTVACHLLTRYYLPGYSSGISTPDDIGVPDPLTNPVVFLAAVLSNLSGFLYYDLKARDKWRESPIHYQTTVEINMGEV